VKQKLITLGVQPMPMTPALFNRYVRTELEQNAELMRAVGIKAQ
jgi:tripartite-type tricarboxylate transporter receptor subunit TctC